MLKEAIVTSSGVYMRVLDKNAGDGQRRKSRLAVVK
jgi:hypothetical protein